MPEMSQSAKNTISPMPWAERLVRVLAQVAGSKLHPGELELVLGQVADLVVMDAAADHDRRQRIARVLVDAPLHLLHAHAGDGREPLELGET